MAKITLVGGMIGDTLDGVTGRGHDALARAERIIFPGNWIGEELKARFGERLSWGRALRLNDVLELFEDVEHGVMLYAGDARIFTGRPGKFPSASALSERLKEAGHEVEFVPGCSVVGFAMHAAGLSLDAQEEDALLIPPALVGEDGGREALEEYARTNAILVMLWAEDAGEEAWKILTSARGESTLAAIVTGLGTPTEHVSRGPLGDLKDAFEQMAHPSVIVVQPPVPEARPPRSAKGRRLTVAVIGSARASDEDLAAAEELGEALVDQGCTVICGGLGGIMEAACRGARASKRYTYGATVGVLPTYEPDDANTYCDIVIATGMNHARNVVVAASADIIAIVGGRAGTLTEMGFGWTLGRPLIAISAQGWGTRLAGQALDDRREEPVYGPLGPLEAAKLCRELGENLSRARKEF